MKKTEKENKLSFLDDEIIRKQGKFTTTIYQKPTFSAVYRNLESFFLRFINLVRYILYFIDVFAFTQIGHNSHTELIFVKGIF